MPQYRKRGAFGRGLHRLLRWAFAAAALLVAAVILLILLYSQLQPPTTTLMLAERLAGGRVVQKWLPIKRISPHLIRAVIVSEDAQFCSHRGVDWEALRQTVEQAGRGGRLRGASTIPMQTMKNLFLWPQRSFVRKGVEIPLAMASSALWSKSRMLEIYLNIAEWAPGIYGAGAAARHHFGKKAARLTRLEAARLAAVLPNPKRRNAAKPDRRTRKRTARILARMKTASRLTSCVSQ